MNTSRLRWFGVIGFCALLVSGRADNWAPNITTTATWQDNATNANRAADRIGALQTMADLTAGRRFGLGRDDAVHLTGHLAAEWWPRFAGLNLGFAGARAEWRHKFGLGAFVPVFSVGASGDVVGAHETARRGTATGLTLALRQRLTDTWRASLTQDFTRLYARGVVFDRTASVTTLAVEGDLTDFVSLTLGASYRDGDVVSYGTPPRPDLVGLASHRTPVDTFGTSRVAYSIGAHTVGLKAGLAHAFDQSSALVLSYEILTTDRSSLRYVNHLVSLALVRQY